MLSGVLVFASPGSTAQLYVGLIVSFYFFALLTRCTPYKNSKTDRTAVIAEANLFFTLLCLLMLKINLTGEWLTREFYDTALTSSNVVVALAPTTIAVVLGFHRLASEWADSASEPLSTGDRVRILDCPESLKICGRTGTVVSSTGETVTVRVHIAASSQCNGWSLAWCRHCLCCCPAKMGEVFEQDLVRSQLQLILRRKQFLRMCAGVCKQLLLFWRSVDALDSVSTSGDADNDSESGQTDQDKLLVNDTVLMVEGIDSAGDLDVDESLDDINLKDEGLAMLRSACEPALARRGVTWEDAKDVIAKLSSVSELQNAIQDPSAFIEMLWAQLEPIIKEEALNRMRPHVEPILQKHGVAWDDAQPVLSMITSINQLRAAAEDPDAFFSELESASGTLARALTIAKLRPVLEPLLRDQLATAQSAAAATWLEGLQWDELVPVLGMIDSVEELDAAVSDPENFLRSLLAAGSVAGKALLVAKLRLVLSPLLAEHAPGASWEQIAAVLEQADMEQLKATIDDPQGFLTQL